MQRRSFFKVGLGTITALFVGVRSKTTLAVYSVFDGEDTHRFIAYSKADTLGLFLKETGYNSMSDLVHDCGPVEVWRSDDDSVIRIREEDNVLVEKTGQEWANTEPRGWFSTTAF